MILARVKHRTCSTSNFLFPPCLFQEGQSRVASSSSPFPPAGAGGAGGPTSPRDLQEEEVDVEVEVGGEMEEDEEGGGQLTLKGPEGIPDGRTQRLETPSPALAAAAAAAAASPQRQQLQVIKGSADVLIHLF